MTYGDFAGLYEEFMQDADYDRWFNEYKKYLPALENKRIADLCCGTGKITRRLKREGAQVVGVDLSPEMLAVAQEHTRRDGLFIPYVCQNIEKLELTRRQDALLCVCDGVNYLSPASFARFLERCRLFLKKDGILLFDVSTVHKLKMQEKEPYFDVREDAALLWESNWEDGKLVMQVTGFLKETQTLYRRFDEVHTLYGHEDTFLKEALHQAGFSAEESVLDIDQKGEALRCLYRCRP